MPALPSRLPAVTLTAIGSRRKVRLDALGRPAVLLCQPGAASGQAGALNQALRKAYPQAQQVLILNLVDLHAVPRLLRRIPEQAMEAAYRQAVQELPAGWQAQEYLLILPDWDGAVVSRLGFRSLERQVGVIAADGQGEICGRYQGESPLPAVIEMLQQMGIQARSG
jgi:hypothetical protein